MPLIQITDDSLAQAAAALAGGALVAFPTETVYGLGGDAFNPAALARIFEVKGRPRFDPLIVHLAAASALETVANLSLLDAAARKNLAALTERFWPGPLTLIVPKQKTIPDLATSGLPSVAVRVPACDAARRLIALSTGAVAAPSANPFGYLSPTTAQHVLAMLGEKVEVILDGGPAQLGVESTVLDLCRGRPRILRPGGAPREAIEALIGPVDGPASDGEPAAKDGLASPGMLKSHYAPHTPLMTHNTEDMRRMEAEETTAYIFFDGASRDMWLSKQTRNTPCNSVTSVVLSETGDMREAAARLFAVLHELDRPEVKQIHAQFAPDTGLGAAINDRLRRASAG